MSIEMKALVSAIVAGLVVLGVTLGLAAVIHKAPATRKANHPRCKMQRCR